MSLPNTDLDANVLSWWRDHQDKFRLLSKMAKQYLGLPCSSAAVERFFSGAGLTHSDLRHRLNDDTLASILWAKYAVYQYE